MEIAILGTGNVGATLGRRLAAVGHQIIFGSRQPESDRVAQLVDENRDAHRAHSVQHAVQQGNVVILATPYDNAEAILRAAGDLSGKILIDCTNPLNEAFDGLRLGFSESAAEKVAHWATGAHVVKAFNTASVATMNDPNYDGQAATMFYCGDCGDAKAVVAGLISDVGMEPVDSGPLIHARYLEPMAMLYIHLAVKQGWGGNCALKMLKREES